MTTMSVELFALPVDRAWTVDDLETVPDDGRRYELLDGMLLVSPAAVNRHQWVVRQLFVLLHEAAPPELRVLPASPGVVLAEDTLFVPDLIVVDHLDLSAKDIRGVPVMAVEVLSSSTQRFDRLVKKDRFGVAGLAHFLLVDPGLKGPPWVEAWRLEDGEFVLVGRASGTEELLLDGPFPVKIVPQRLLDW